MYASNEVNSRTKENYNTKWVRQGLNGKQGNKNSIDKKYLQKYKKQFSHG